ncbi:MAG: glutathionylspermidine synthase family protein [Myxococcales bacterium]|nr:glutathionylspermidine synthase family protein [Myxococcales bacterium]
MSDAAYEQFARALLDGAIIADPWLDGTPRFSLTPAVISRDEAAALLRVGADVASVYDELCRIVDEDPELLDSFFALSPAQKVMWQASAPLWHAIGRVDVFETHEGYAITELNSDTPTGEAETVELSRLIAPRHPELVDPNTALASRFVAIAEALTRRWVGPDAPRTAAIVYPTEFTEDLSLIKLYRQWLSAAGWRVVLGSPYNLSREADGPLRCFHEPVSLLIRHYKTDWWGERGSVWRDDPIPDAAPLVGPLEAALGAFVDHRTAVLNPFGAVLPQNKRAMALMWEHIHRFSHANQAVIERLVPYTVRLETLHEAELMSQRDAWVLKSDYGAEGDEVLIGRDHTDTEWREVTAECQPGRWVAQRYFAARQDAEGHVTNWGVFVLGGEAVGLYARRSKGATDETALSLATLIRP